MLNKIVAIPVADFSENYYKFTSKVQNTRNIHSTIPEKLAGLFKDLEERKVSLELYGSLVKAIGIVITENLDKANSIKILSKLLCSPDRPEDYAAPWKQLTSQLL